MRDLSTLPVNSQKQRQRIVDAAQHRRTRGTISQEDYQKFISQVDVQFNTPRILTALDIVQVGKKLGRLTVENFGKNKWGQTTAVCVCDCGRTASPTISSLASGESKSCGCLRLETAHPMGSGRIALAQLFSRYKSSARRKGLLFEITLDQFAALTSASCCYCGNVPQKTFTCSLSSGRKDSTPFNGLDRQNNNQGYISENTVTCCYRCNYSKGKSSLSIFMSWALRFGGGGFTVSEKFDDLAAAKNAYSIYKHIAKKKNLDFQLQFADFLALIRSPCAYCGTDPHRIWKVGSAHFTCNGIDRIENVQGYTLENSAPCCSECNYAKRGMSVEEFKTWTGCLAAHLKAKIARQELLFTNS